MEQLLSILSIILFCVTFYYTIIRFITLTKLFESTFNSLHQSFTFKSTKFWTLINLLMWCYQIYFWFHYFNIL